MSSVEGRAKSATAMQSAAAGSRGVQRSVLGGVARGSQASRMVLEAAGVFGAARGGKKRPW
jgi:hypothetical protein